MKKFFSLLTLGVILLAVDYRLLLMAPHPMGMYPWQAGILLACGVAGLFFLCAAIYRFDDFCRKWLADKRLQKKLERATARVRLQCRPPKILFSKKVISRC